METQLDGPEHEYTKYPAARAAAEYAFYYGAFSIALTVLPILFGFAMDHWAVRVFSVLAMVVSLVLMLKHFRDQRNSGVLTLGQGMAVSALTGLFAGIVYAIFSYILFRYLMPDLIAQIQEKAAESMYDAGMNDEQIAEQMEMSAFFFSPGFFAVAGFLSSVFSFTFFGLIVSAAMKREP
jgi:hypothetical protein